MSGRADVDPAPEPSALDAATSALRADLEATRSWTPSSAVRLAEATAQRSWWLDQWADGAPLVLCLLAQDVQEALHEDGDTWWPLCPEHRDHPLRVEPDLGPDPFWVCQHSGLPVSAIGFLPVSARPAVADLPLPVDRVEGGSTGGDDPTDYADVDEGE